MDSTPIKKILSYFIDKDENREKLKNTNTIFKEATDTYLKSQKEKPNTSYTTYTSYTPYTTYNSKE